MFALGKKLTEISRTLGIKAPGIIERQCGVAREKFESALTIANDEASRKEIGLGEGETGHE